MSYGATTTVFNFGQAVQQVTVAGAQFTAGLAAFATVGAMAGAMAAADGMLAVADLVRGAISDTSAARGTRASFGLYQTGLSADALPLVRAGFEGRGIRFVEGGILKLADGPDRSIAYTAVDGRGRVLFFVRPGADGRVEILAQQHLMRDGQVARQAVEAVLSETVMALAVETLRRQGFQTAQRAGSRLTLTRRTADGTTEQVLVDYRGGRLDAKATSIDPSGRLQDGNACPYAADLFAYFPDAALRPLGAGDVPRGPGGRPSGGAGATHRHQADADRSVRHQSFR